MVLKTSKCSEWRCLQNENEDDVENTLGITNYPFSSSDEEELLLLICKNNYYVLNVAASSCRVVHLFKFPTINIEITHYSSSLVFMPRHGSYIS